MGTVEFDGFVPSWIVPVIKRASGPSPTKKARKSKEKQQEDADEPTMKFVYAQAPLNHLIRHILNDLN